MATLAQTPSGDLDTSFAVVTDPDEAAALILTNKFRRFLGEWFRDVREGIPYFESVFLKSPDLGAIRQIFRNVILSTPPVVSTELDLSVGKDRLLSFSFAAKTKSGATIVGGSGVPFIVERPA